MDERVELCVFGENRPCVVGKDCLQPPPILARSACTLEMWPVTATAKPVRLGSSTISQGCDHVAVAGWQGSQAGCGRAAVVHLCAGNSASVSEILAQSTTAAPFSRVR